MPAPAVQDTARRVGAGAVQGQPAGGPPTVAAWLRGRKPASHPCLLLCSLAQPVLGTLYIARPRSRSAALLRALLGTLSLAHLQARMRGLAILPPPPNDASPLFEHVCATVLQQSHLCPVPLEYQVRASCYRDGTMCGSNCWARKTHPAVGGQCTQELSLPALCPLLPALPAAHLLGAGPYAGGVPPARCTGAGRCCARSRL